MPRGTRHRFRRMVTGLLVLVGLLLSGAQIPATAALLHTGYSQNGSLAQTIDVTDRSSVTPCRHQHSDNGLACCLDGMCTTQTAWLADASAIFLSRPTLAAKYMPGPDLWSPGIRTIPAQPPPRAAV